MESSLRSAFSLLPLAASRLAAAGDTLARHADRAAAAVKAMGAGKASIAASSATQSSSASAPSAASSALRAAKASSSSTKVLAARSPLARLLREARLDIHDGAKDRQGLRGGAKLKSARAAGPLRASWLAQEAARREIVAPAVSRGGTDAGLGAASAVMPCMSLGGLSQVSFAVLLGTDASAWSSSSHKATSELAARLQDQNEFLEDNHVYMTAFIERQKQRIEDLEKEVRHLRNQLAERGPGLELC